MRRWRRWARWRWGVAVALGVGVLITLASGVAGAADAPADTRPGDLRALHLHGVAPVLDPVVTLVCFAVCYACFMRQEIRST